LFRVTTNVDTPTTFALAGASSRLRPSIPMLLERGHRARLLTRDLESPVANVLRFERWAEAQDWERLKTPNRVG
jgi:hypothetical protein